MERACKRCSSSAQPIFHAVYPGLPYDFKPPVFGVETRAQKRQREEKDRLFRKKGQLYGDNFDQYTVTDVDNIECTSFLRAWLFAIPTSLIVNDADKLYFEFLTQQIIYRMISLNANV